jgi:hypothetical protein
MDSQSTERTVDSAHLQEVKLQAQLSLTDLRRQLTSGDSLDCAWMTGNPYIMR